MPCAGRDETCLVLSACRMAYFMQKYNNKLYKMELSATYFLYIFC